MSRLEAVYKESNNTLLKAVADAERMALKWVIGKTRTGSWNPASLAESLLKEELKDRKEE